MRQAGVWYRTTRCVAAFAAGALLIGLSATIRAKNAQGRVVASTHTDAAGRYVLELRPGAYVVDALTGGALPRCTPVDVTVTADHSTRAPISCDTGIR